MELDYQDIIYPKTTTNKQKTQTKEILEKKTM